jgi:hypothetical protein
MNFINLTPHAINLNNGNTFPPSGQVARVSSSFSEIVDGLCCQEFGEVVGLPEPKEGVLYIVSGLIMSASDRTDIVAPATGHSEAIRNGKGQIVSVPCFISK